ncbi:hypothetical protein ACLBXX_10310 [Microbacterium sp. C23T]
MRFVDSFFDKDNRYSLGRDTGSLSAYLSIPVSSSTVDYEEYYAISDAEYSTLSGDLEAAKAFAEQCRRHELDDRLILKPGWNRGSPR